MSLGGSGSSGAGSGGNSSSGGSRGPKETAYHYGFNQDASCVALGSSRGFSVFNTHPFCPSLHESVGGVGIVEMLYCTSLLALVGAGDQAGFSPRCLKIWNTKRQASLFDVAFVSKIVAVRLNRRRLVVALERALYIFGLEKMEKLQELAMGENKGGLLALSAREEPSYLAYPAHELGVVLLHDVLSLRLINKITVHKTKLAALAFSLDGSLLATASETGTVIRVVSVPDGRWLYTLRRGRSPCTIYSLAFNHAGTRLAASSDKGTVHIFQLSSSFSSSSSAFSSSSSSSSPSSSLSDAGPPSPTTTHNNVNSKPASSSSSSSFSSKSLSFPPPSFPPSSSPTTTTGQLSFSPPSLLPSFSLSSLGLPKKVTDIVTGVEGTRSFAQARLKTHSINNSKEGGKWKKNVCALVPSRGSSRRGGEEGREEGEALVVLTAEGHCYQYAVDVREGGTCRLVDEKTMLQEETGSQALAQRFLSG